MEKNKFATMQEVDHLITSRLLKFRDVLAENGEIKVSKEPRWFYDDGSLAPNPEDCTED